MNEDHGRRMVTDTWNGTPNPPSQMPTSADIVVIGGGILGISTAWFLARQGVSVIVCEKGHIAGEQSSRNWGWIRQQGRDPRELPMMISAMRIWETLAEDIGEDVGFAQDGCMFVARKDKDVEGYHQWMEIGKEYGLDSRVLDGDELRQRVKGSTADWKGALYTASDARAEPHKATAAIARAATREGATLLTSCAVRGLDTAGGQVSGVITEHGAIKTSVVLCAAGAWTSMFCRSIGISVPQLKVRGNVARTTPGPRILDACIFDKKLGIRPRDDGGYTIGLGDVLHHSITPSTFRYAFKFLPALLMEYKTLRIRIDGDFFTELGAPKTWSMDDVSPMEQMRVLDPQADPRVIRKILKNFHSIFPEMKDVGIAEAWAGMVETSPDVVPIIGEVGDAAGFYIATGLSGHGFGIGPGAGLACAAMLTNDDNPIDMNPFRLGRFYDGTPVRPMRAI